MSKKENKMLDLKVGDYVILHNFVNFCRLNGKVAKIVAADDIYSERPHVSCLDSSNHGITDHYIQKKLCRAAGKKLYEKQQANYEKGI